jgi:outer membrane cobalamin receptor
MTKRILSFFIVNLFCLPLILMAQEKDSIKSTLLDEIHITDSFSKDSLSKESVSILDTSIIKKIPFISVGEMAKYIAGVNVKDYGGVGGLKTISVRGLGSGHSAVVYDGISVTDFQTGQVDLGKFSSSNIKAINLFNGQSFSMLQTARALAFANVFLIETQKPSFDSLENFKASMKTSYGSFNYANLGLNASYKANNIWTLWTDLDIQNTKGNYPYLLHYGYGENDSTSKEIRQNSDYFGFRGELNAFGSFNGKTDLKLKAYYFYSERGLPMSTTLYYLKSAQRLWDENFFLQGIFTHKFNNKLSYRSHLKGLYSYSHFLDAASLNLLGYQSDKYYQREYYLNNVVAYKILKNLSASFTNDIFFNNLNTSSSFYSKANRTSSISALSLLFDNSKLLINTNILHNYIMDYAYKDNSQKNHNHFSPFVSIGYTWNNIFSLSAFYKDVFRMPSFNDLYFNRVTFASLKPEKAQQWNLHIAFSKDFGYYKSSLFSLSVDAYYNKVKDKIVAVPQRNLFVWSIINFGQVDIKGVDIQSSFRTYLSFSIDLNIRATYSYQKAVDVSNPNSLSYNNQLPYTPFHSGSLFINLIHPFMDFAYTINYVGKRFALAENIDRNMLKPYQDHSITLSKNFLWNKRKINLGVSCINLFGVQYEVVRNYPMPQRQFRINLKIDLK